MITLSYPVMKTTDSYATDVFGPVSRNETIIDVKRFVLLTVVVVRRQLRLVGVDAVIGADESEFLTQSIYKL